MQYLLNNTSFRLRPAFFSNGKTVGNTDDINPHIDLGNDNTNISDRYKNVNIVLFKEALKINERKPTLNTGIFNTSI